MSTSQPRREPARERLRAGEFQRLGRPELRDLPLAHQVGASHLLPHLKHRSACGGKRRRRPRHPQDVHSGAGPALGELYEPGEIDGRAVDHKHDDDGRNGSPRRVAGSDQALELREQGCRAHRVGGEVRPRERAERGSDVRQPGEPAPVALAPLRGCKGRDHEVCRRVQGGQLHEHRARGGPGPRFRPGDPERTAAREALNERHPVDAREPAEHSLKLLPLGPRARPARGRTHALAARQPRLSEPDLEKAPVLRPAGPQARAALGGQHGEFLRARRLRRAGRAFGVRPCGESALRGAQRTRELPPLRAMRAAPRHPAVEPRAQHHERRERDEDEAERRARREKQDHPHDQGRENRDERRPRGLRRPWRLRKLKLIRRVDRLDERGRKVRDAAHGAGRARALGSGAQ